MKHKAKHQSSIKDDAPINYRTTLCGVEVINTDVKTHWKEVDCVNCHYVKQNPKKSIFAKSSKKQALLRRKFKNGAKDIYVCEICLEYYISVNKKSDVCGQCK